jgi:hypothetical protein
VRAVEGWVAAGHLRLLLLLLLLRGKPPTSTSLATTKWRRQAGQR